jgi:hypothetical protein
LPAAKLAGLGRSVLQKVGIGGGAAGITEQALQETGVALGREEKDPLGVGIAAATGGLAETIKPAFQGTREFLRARSARLEKAQIGRVAPAVERAQEATEGLAEVTGERVGLFQAQQTQTPSELIKQRILGQLSSSSQTAADALQRQNREAFQATEGLLNTIAPSQVVETGADRFRSAAQAAIETRKISRAEAASPLYKQAFRRQRQGSTPLINTKGLESKIAGIIRGSDETGQVARSLEKINDKIVNTKGDLQKLHSVKLEIDNLIEGQGENALGRTTKRAITETKNDLVDLLVDQSPSYRAARDEFIRLTPAVEELDRQLIGKIANISDDQLREVSSRVFNPREINPAVLKQARQVIKEVDPGAWNDIVRVEAERRFGALGELLSDQGDEAISNIPGQIKRALFGNEKNRKVFLSALNNEQRQNFRYLEDVLKRASTGRAAGSPTTPFKEALSQMRGVAGVLRDTIFRPVSTVQGVGEASLFDRRTSALAKVMFDPQWRPQMQHLMSLDSNSPAAARAMTQLFNEVDKAEETE